VTVLWAGKTVTATVVTEAAEAESLEKILTFGFDTEGVIMEATWTNEARSDTGVTLSLSLNANAFADVKTVEKSCVKMPHVVGVTESTIDGNNPADRQNRLPSCKVLRWAGVRAEHANCKQDLAGVPTQASIRRRVAADCRLAFFRPNDCTPKATGLTDVPETGGVTTILTQLSQLLCFFAGALATATKTQKNHAMYHSCVGHNCFEEGILIIDQ
jgi:hypothetical protein